MRPGIRMHTAKIHMAGYPDQICGRALTCLHGRPSQPIPPCPTIRPQHTGHVSALSLQSVGLQLDSISLLWNFTRIHGILLAVWFVPCTVIDQ